MIRDVVAMLPADWSTTVSVARRAGTDRYGNRLPDTVHELPGVVIAQQSSADPLDLSQLTTTRVVLSAPPGADLRAGDVVTAPPGYYAAGRYEVVGDPASGPLGVAAELKRAGRQ